MQKKHDALEELVERGARKALQLEHQHRNVNMYRATERLLRNYKQYRALIEHPEDFEFFPQSKSKSISIAPPPGSGMVDKVDLLEDYVAARKKAYEAVLINWLMAEKAIQHFSKRNEFVVIRMYYFNEDINGNYRGDEKPYTFEEIAQELAAVGIDRSVRTLRGWRTRMVQDMTVVLFGTSGAVSVEARDMFSGKNDQNAEPSAQTSGEGAEEKAGDRQP